VIWAKMSRHRESTILPRTAALLQVIRRTFVVGSIGSASINHGNQGSHRAKRSRCRSADAEHTVKVTVRLVELAAPNLPVGIGRLARLIVLRGNSQTALGSLGEENRRIISAFHFFSFHCD
jgi:hypothetical protein